VVGYARLGVVLALIDEETDCCYCGEERAVVLCLGCGIPLCSGCVKLEDYGFGCDGGKVVAFCPDCFADPAINTVLDFEH
jgi:hypothetical protein